MPVVDTHVHVWNLERLELPWLVDAPAVLRRSVGWRDYEDAARGLGIVGAMYVEVDASERSRDDEAALAADAVEREPMVLGAVLGASPGTSRFRERVARWLRRGGMCGVRQVLHVRASPPGRCLEHAFVEDVRWLGEHGLVFELCMRPGELDDAASLAAACPNTLLVLDHCGNPAVRGGDNAAWRAGLDRLAAHPNACAKVSGLVESAGGADWRPEELAPFVDATIDAFGAERVVAGGNWPVCELDGGHDALGRWIRALRAVVADRDPSVQRRLLHDNAVRIYRLVKPVAAASR